MVSSWGESLSPGNEQREYWGSQSADMPGSRNIIGIKNPAVDALIDRVIFAKDRDDLVAATKALDRVLLWNFYVVPQWNYPKVRTARWDRFGRPSELPKYGLSGFPTLVVVRRRQGRQDRQAILRDFSRMAQLSRRHVLGLGIGAVGASWLRPAAADVRRRGSRHIGVRRSEISGRLSSFRLCQYRRAEGRRVLVDSLGRAYNQSFLTFNSLNAYILKGEGAQGMDMTFAPLMVRAGDEPDAMYGLVAKSVQISADKLSYRFTLRPEARFHDGSKLTAHDAAFSLTTLKTKGHPLILQQMRDMVKAEAPDDATLVVTFAEKRARDVPLYVASLPIFSQAYYATRPFDESTLDIPLGSGPYKVGKFEVNRYIEFERVKDWWGADLPVARGSYNFDIVRYEFYRDRDVAFEGFTAKSYLFREEFTARVWATRYDFPAVKDGRVKRETLPDDTPSGAQGWFINTRRDTVQGSAGARSADPGVRFRMDQQDHHVRRLCAHPFRRSRIRT